MSRGVKHGGNYNHLVPLNHFVYDSVGEFFG